MLRSGCIDDDGWMLFFLTLTAPGDGLHVDKRTGEICDCTGPDGVDPAVWNALLPEHWSKFMIYLRRLLGDVEYAKAVEVQMKRLHRTGRGLLHLHVIIRCRIDATHHKEAVREIAMRWGFGHEVDLVPLQPHHVLDVARYGAKSCDDRQPVDLLDLRTGEVMHGPRRMRTLTCSRNYGDTIKQVKAAQRAWVLDRLGASEVDGLGRRARSLDSNTPRSTCAPAQGAGSAIDRGIQGLQGLRLLSLHGGQSAVRTWRNHTTE